MNLLLFLLLIVTTPVTKNVVVIYVQPSNEIFTSEEQTQAYTSVIESAQFWSQQSPIKTDVRVISTQFLTTTANVYDDPTVLLSLVSMPDNVIPVFVIDASNSRRILQHCCAGLAMYNAIYLLNTTSTAVFAHEFGHHLYNLPHQYKASIDIMSLDPIPAWQRHTIGCDSLAVMQHPCTRIYLPTVIRRLKH